MHAAYARSSGSEELFWHDDVPAKKARRPQSSAGVEPRPAPSEPSVYGARSRPNWVAILAIVLLHAAGLAALISYKIAQPAAKARPPLVVELLSLPTAPPPPAQTSPSEPRPTPEQARAAEIVAPKPVVDIPTPAPAPIVAASAAPAPVPAPLPKVEAAPAVAAVAAPPAVAAAPVSISDLSTRMIAGRPPQYPIESRRRREQGTVVLSVLVGADGAVAEIGVSRSSGFSRLDKAARDAVRRWRWSPTTRDGRPVLVRGYVDIPFVLNG